MRAFTLLEVITVTAILAIVGAAGAAVYSNYGKSVQVEDASRSISFMLKEARSKAIAGQDGRHWGVRMINGSRDTFELFSSPSTYADPGVTVERTEYLPTGISFTDPSESSLKDIIFSRIAGTTSPATVGLTTQTESVTVTVSGVGSIY